MREDLDLNDVVCNKLPDLSKGWVVLGEVFVGVGVEDSIGGVANSEGLGSCLSVDVIVGASIASEVRRFVDESSTL